MEIDMQLFGALRGLADGDVLRIQVNGTSIADARAAVATFAEAHWPASKVALLPSCAFASSTSLLRDAMPLPEDGHLVILPPVNGG
ncbi:MAG: thiamine biosynthesis protein ThiS [Arenimonas sp.]|nr:thiamine biosynthesis protein ThiS [Arenimonas sp.]